MSEKKKKNAQPAEEKKPSKDDAETVSEKPSETVAPFDFSKIDPEKIKMAEELGIPIGQILQWVQSVEVRFKYIADNVATKDDLPIAFEKTIEKLRQKQIDEMKKKYPQGVPQQGGGEGKLLMGLIDKFAGGGGQDSEMAALTKKIMQASYDNLIKRGDMADRIVDAVVAKLASKTVSDITS